VLNSGISPDENTKQLVDKWMKMAMDSLTAMGFQPKDTVLRSGSPLDGRDEKIRAGNTNLTVAITKGMMEAIPSAQLAVFNSGSVRVDDFLYLPVTQYDILRAMPYINEIKLIGINGDILTKLLNAGRSVPPGDGMYLHYSSETTYDPAGKVWLVNRKAIDPKSTYKVAIGNYILSGDEKSVAFLKAPNAFTMLSYKSSVQDINHALIEHLKK